MPIHRLTDAGFAVVAQMYRDSEGAPGRDELGGADLADLMNIQPVIAALPYADAGQMFLYGESKGGMMAPQALRDGFPARAAAVVGACDRCRREARPGSVRSRARRTRDPLVPSIHG